MSKITGPLAAIVVSIIITLGLLIMTGSLPPKPHTYATVEYDGGYKKLGVISSEEIFTRAEIKANNEMLTSGSFEEVIAELKKQTKNQNIETLTWKSGVSISASAGIRWVGSEGAFNLTRMAT